jgi:heme/copper-type cytochrome/quinol oxidase subunit 2
MWFYIVLIVAAIALIVWFVRTPTFRAYRRSPKDPGQTGSGRSQIHN